MLLYWVPKYTKAGWYKLRLKKILKTTNVYGKETKESKLVTFFSIIFTLGCIFLILNTRIQSIKK